MAIATSGQICFSQLQSEFGGSNPICLSEYYRNGSYVPGTETTGSADWEDPYGVAASPSSITITRYYETTKTYKVRYERGPLAMVDGPWIYSYALYNGGYTFSYYVRAFIDDVLWNPFNMKDGWVHKGTGGYTLSASPEFYNTNYTDLAAVTGGNYGLFGPIWNDQYKDGTFKEVYTYVSYVDDVTALAYNGPTNGGAPAYDPAGTAKTPYMLTLTAGIGSGPHNLLSDREIHLPDQPNFASGGTTQYNYRTATMIPVGTTTTKNINTSVPTSGQVCLSNFRGAYKP